MEILSIIFIFLYGIVTFFSAKWAASFLLGNYLQLRIIFTKNRMFFYFLPKFLFALSFIYIALKSNNGALYFSLLFATWFFIPTIGRRSACSDYISFMKKAADIAVKNGQSTLEEANEYVESLTIKEFMHDIENRRSK